MYESTRTPGKKFGSSFVGKRYDSYEGGKQPGEENENEHAEPQEVHEDHGPAHQVIYHHDHEKGEHKVTAFHDDGHVHESVHSTSAEAHETGGALANTDVKRREHSLQQGSQSQEESFEQPDLA